ncbi:hypothetical protein ACFQ7F_32955 [Streptomyces sp. NPDC056486]|uniref:hypothetical protein n=1 Tax=Streptomyces sp. NPDC056486 TaxID=3345835 RepID=UPI0036C7E335
MPAALTAMGIVLALTVCAVAGIVIHEYPALKEPLTAAFGTINTLGLISAFVVSMTHRR